MKESVHPCTTVQHIAIHRNQSRRYGQKVWRTV